MIYTYEKDTGLVVMISDGENKYSNDNWADFESDASALEQFKTRQEGTYLYLENGELVIK